MLDGLLVIGQQAGVVGRWYGSRVRRRGRGHHAVARDHERREALQRVRTHRQVLVATPDDADAVALRTLLFVEFPVTVLSEMCLCFSKKKHMSDGKYA